MNTNICCPLFELETAASIQTCSISVFSCLKSFLQRVWPAMLILPLNWVTLNHRYTSWLQRASSKTGENYCFRTNSSSRDALILNRSYFSDATRFGFDVIRKSVPLYKSFQRPMRSPILFSRRSLQARSPAQHRLLNRTPEPNTRAWSKAAMRVFALWIGNI